MVHGLDDASRFVVNHGLFDSPASENALRVLDEAVAVENLTPYSLLTVLRHALIKGLIIFEEHLNEPGST